MAISGQLFRRGSATRRIEALSSGAFLLPNRVERQGAALIEAIHAICQEAPFRQLVTPGGHRMSVAMTSCGDLGWVADRRGYRYCATDQESGRAWPAMPQLLKDLAGAAAGEAGFRDYKPDSCLINRYLPGNKLSLHQDKSERDHSHPVVSFSLGLPATFLWGGLHRTDKPAKLLLEHGDVLIWGGPDRLRYHGVLPLPDGKHRLLGTQRINLTFRKAG